MKITVGSIVRLKGGRKTALVTKLFPFSPFPSIEVDRPLHRSIYFRLDEIEEVPGKKLNRGLGAVDRGDAERRDNAGSSPAPRSIKFALDSGFRIE